MPIRLNPLPPHCTLTHWDQATPTSTTAPGGPYTKVKAFSQKRHSFWRVRRQSEVLFGSRSVEQGTQLSSGTRARRQCHAPGADSWGAQRPGRRPPVTTQGDVKDTADGSTGRHSLIHLQGAHELQKRFARDLRGPREALQGRWAAPALAPRSHGVSPTVAPPPGASALPGYPGTSHCGLSSGLWGDRREGGACSE